MISEKRKPELEELNLIAGRTALKLFELDTADRGQIGPVIKAQIREFGKIDALINCIGITHPELLFSDRQAGRGSPVTVPRKPRLTV